MIQLQKLRIKEFRGIRELELELDGKSLVVVGPNGSGKSGVVDAIDFVLTGSVARLSGAGTGGISVTKHAPHVHKRDDPASAQVTLEFTHVQSGQTGVLTRSVKTAGQYTLEPNTTELAAAVAWAAQHSEITLSRREVIKYVNAEPGRRAQEVQALLKLDRIDETRRLLQAARTKSSAAVKTADSGMKAAEDGVKRILDVSSLLATDVLAAVNQRRSVLGLEELASIDLETDLSSGAKVGGRDCTVLSVTHPVSRPYFDFHIAQIFIDTELNMPVRYCAYTWPQTAGGEPVLLEEYTYQNVKTNIGLTDADFDQKNSKYNF